MRERLEDIEQRIVSIEVGKKSIKNRFIDLFFWILTIFSILIIGISFARLAWKANIDTTIGSYYYNPAYLFFSFLLLISLVSYSIYKGRSRFNGLLIKRYLLKVISTFLTIFFLMPTGYYLWRITETFAGKLPPIEETDFSTLVNIFIPILAAVGLGIYVWISKELKEQNKALIKKDREAFRAEVCTIFSYIFGSIYSERENINKFNNFLDKALAYDDEALGILKNLDKKEYKDTIFNIKNDLACDLADLHLRNNSKNEPNKADKDRALKIKDELWKMRISGAINEYKNPHTAIETCAWVEYCFAENDKERNAKTFPILMDLKTHYPEYYEKIKNKYDKLTPSLV